MAKQGERESQAKRHVAVMNVVLGKETAAAIEGTRVIEAGYAPDVADVQEPAEPTAIEFADGDIVGAILQAEKPVAVLDSASYRYPGGGYLRGWSGPEEDLCAESNLYSILEAFQKSYYSQNKQSASGELYTSRALAVPDSVFTRNGEMAACGVCVMAAPNRARALQRNRSERECDLALAERIDAALRVLADFHPTTVVLPAFGCGQMGNDATQVARLVREWVEAHEGVFPRLVFSLWRGPDADAFRAVFADRMTDEPVEEAAPVQEPEEDSEDFGWEQYRISE